MLRPSFSCNVSTFPNLILYSFTSLPPFHSFLTPPPSPRAFVLRVIKTFWPDYEGESSLSFKQRNRKFILRSNYPLPSSVCRAGGNYSLSTLYRVGKGGRGGSWKEARTKHAETKPRLKMIKAKSVRQEWRRGFSFSFFFFSPPSRVFKRHRFVPCKRMHARPRLPTIVVFVLSPDSLFIVPFLRRGKIPP